VPCKQNCAEWFVLVNDVGDQPRVSGRSLKEWSKANGLFIPCAKVVEHNWKDASSQQHFGRVTANVSGTARDKD
jgi:hypothetical protein